MPRAYQSVRCMMTFGADWANVVDRWPESSGPGELRDAYAVEFGLMPVDLMFVLATSAFAWGLSLATYRWFAIYNGWPMGEWQAHRPGLPIAIGLFAVLFAMLFAVARGGSTMVIVPLIGALSALVWTALTRVGAQSALIFAPIAVMLLLTMWIAAATVAENSVAPARLETPPLSPVSERTPLTDQLRGIPTDRQPAPVPPPTR